MAWRGLALGAWAAGAAEAVNLSDIIRRVLAGNAMVVCWLMLLRMVGRSTGFRNEDSGSGIRDLGSGIRRQGDEGRKRTALVISPLAVAVACLICLPGAVVMAMLEAGHQADWGYGIGLHWLWSRALDHAIALAVLVQAMLCVTSWLARVGSGSKQGDSARATQWVPAAASVTLAVWALEQAWSQPDWPTVGVMTWAAMLLLPGVIAACLLRVATGSAQDRPADAAGAWKGAVAVALVSTGLGWLVWSLLAGAAGWHFWVAALLLLDALALAVTGGSFVRDLATRRYRPWLDAAVAGFIVGAAWWLAGQGLRGAWGGGSAVEFISAFRLGEPWLCGLRAIPVGLVAVRACLLADGLRGSRRDSSGRD